MSYNDDIAEGYTYAIRDVLKLIDEATWLSPEDKARLKAAVTAMHDGAPS